MIDQSIRRRQIWLMLVALLCAAGTWLYASRVLIPYQIRDAAAHNIPRGNLSDFYPRWLGARELLLHGRDPYSPELTREIQMGFYGRPLPPEGPGGRNYEQGFYYPVYVAFLLAPTIDLPFDVVRKAFFWVLLGLTVVTIPLWLRLLRWPLSLWGEAAVVLFTIGSLPVLLGLKLEQMTLLVAALLAAAMVLLVSGHHIPAGILLAIATIKPQLVWLVLFWLTIWTLADWRRRHRWAASFLLTMVILCAASEWYLPHWIPRFWQSIREYRSFTGEMSVMDVLMGSPWSRALELLALGGVIIACWRQRRTEANSEGFAFTLSLVMAITVFVVPSYGFYNQVLLIPAVLVLVRQRRTIWQRSAVGRLLLVLTAGLVFWPWIASLALASLSFVLPQQMVERGWAVPFWTSMLIPLGVAAMMLVLAGQRSVAASADLPS